MANRHASKRIIIRFNKPYGVISHHNSPDDDRPRVLTYVDVPGVHPVGRLDKNSEGLMIVTNDRQLTHRLMEPKYEHPRTYWVQVERIPDDDALERVRTGVEIRGNYITKPAKVQMLEDEPDLPPRDPPIRFRKNVPAAWLAMTLTEGRNRQVRRMTAAVGHPTLRLVRMFIGPISLEGLAPGAWQYLTPEEETALRRSTGLIE